MKKLVKKYNPSVAVIMDGFGIGEKYEGNAVQLARKPNYDFLRKKYLYTELKACGEDVGLEKNAISGSEVGHNNIGAGRVVEQEPVIISQSIENGEFFKNPAFQEAVAHVKKYNSRLHLMGLMSNGHSPHSSFEHYRLLVELAKREKIDRLYVHLFTDGRDSRSRSAIELIKLWQTPLLENKIGQIASLGGRFYGMDRAKNWDRLKKAYAAIVCAQGKKVSTPQEAIEKAYAKNIDDEFIPPSVIMNEGKSLAKVEDDDAVIFFNLRSDRARQLTKLFVLEKSLETTLPEPRIKNLKFVALTGFGPDVNIKVAFEVPKVKNTLPVALKRFNQLYISESEKFAHVTYFLNGGYPNTIVGENRVMIPSPNVDNYAETPAMSAKILTEIIVKYLKEEVYEFILVNFPNPDMLGHTGNIKAAVKGIEYVDKCIGKIWKELEKNNGYLFVFSDHGNAEEMIDEKDKTVLNFHTLNPVPFIAAGDKLIGKKLNSDGKLGNIAPTILEVMNLEKPKEMISSLLN